MQMEPFKRICYMTELVMQNVHMFCLHKSHVNTRTVVGQTSHAILVKLSPALIYSPSFGFMPISQQMPGLEKHCL